MIIKIILPSRGRPHRLQEFVDSVRQTESEPNEIHVLIDSDDPTIEEYKSIKGIVLYVREPSGVSDRLIFLSEVVDADIYACLADDVKFETKNWDVKIKQSIPSHGICIVKCNEVHNASLCHPIYTKKIFDLIGGWPFGLKHWFLDSWMEDIGRETKTIIALPDVILHHYHHTVRPELNDATYALHKPMYEHDSKIWNSPEVRTLMAQAKTRIKDAINAYNSSHK